MPLVEFFNSSVDLFLGLVSCISLSYVGGRVLQQFSGFVSCLVSCISLSYAAGRVLQRFSGFVSNLVSCISLSYAAAW